MTQEDIIEMVRQAEDAVIANPNLDWKIEFAKLVEDKTRRELREEIVYTWVPPSFVNFAVKAEREACESIEYDLAKSPAMFATMAEYKSYRDGVEKYRAAIRARGEA